MFLFPLNLFSASKQKIPGLDENMYHMVVLTIKAINSDCNLFHKSNNTGNRIRTLKNPKRTDSNIEQQYSQRDKIETKTQYLINPSSFLGHLFTDRLCR